jgi:hypothetical protein
MRNKFFLPEAVLSDVFRRQIRRRLTAAYAAGKFQFHGLLQGLAQPESFRNFVRQLFAPHWVVYCKPPFGGPELALRYLDAYTHRVAISNRCRGKVISS